MHLRKFLLRPLPPLAALSVSGALLFLVLALLLSLAERSRTPAHFLRADALELFVEEASETRSKEPARQTQDGLVSLLFPEIPRLRLPPEVLPFLQGDRAKAQFRIHGIRQRVEFHRLKPGAHSYREAQGVALQFSPRATIRGVYFVWSDRDVGEVLRTPSQGGTLARDVRFRSMRQSLSPSAPFFLYMRLLEPRQFPIVLPVFLQSIVQDSQDIGIAAEREKGQFLLSVSLPGVDPSRDTSFSPLSLSSQMEKQPEPLLFGAEGADFASESETLVTLLADGNEERALLLRGVLAASMKNAFGDSVLPALPYTLLVRHGSGAAFPWVLALKQSAEAEIFRQSVEEAFLSQVVMAKVRERILPGEITVRDVLLDPDSLRHDASARGLMSVVRGSQLLLSNSEEFLQDTIAASSPTPTVTHGVTLDRRALPTFQRLLSPESAFAASLETYLGGMQSVTWYRVAAGGFIRHLFLLKP